MADLQPLSLDDDQMTQLGQAIAARQAQTIPQQIIPRPSTLSVGPGAGTQMKLDAGTNSGLAGPLPTHVIPSVQPPLAPRYNLPQGTLAPGVTLLTPPPYTPESAAVEAHFEYNRAVAETPASVLKAAAKNESEIETRLGATGLVPKPETIPGLSKEQKDAINQGVQEAKNEFASASPMQPITGPIASTSPVTTPTNIGNPGHVSAYNSPFSETAAVAQPLKPVAQTEPTPLTVAPAPKALMPPAEVAQSVTPKAQPINGLTAYGTPFGPQPQLGNPGLQAEQQANQFYNGSHANARPAISALLSRAEQIHNPFLRTLGEIGAGGLRGLETIGEIAAPGIMQNIPGTIGNFNAKQQFARQLATQNLANQKTQADVTKENLENQIAQANLTANAPVPVEGKDKQIIGYNTPQGNPIPTSQWSPEMTARAEASKSAAIEQPKPGSTEAAVVQKQTEINPSTGKNYTAA